MYLIIICLADRMLLFKAVKSFWQWQHKKQSAYDRWTD